MAAGGRVSFPAGARRTVADIKEIAGGHTDEEVYAMLRECNMDPNETVQRLLLQDTFHEVKRKRDRKKEGSKEPSDCRWRPSLQGRGGKSSQRNYCSRNFSGFNGRCAISGKENVINHIMGNDSGSTLAINRNIDVKASTSTPSSSSNLAIGPSQPFDHATVVVTSSSAHQPLRPASDSVVVPSLDPHGPGDGGAAKQAIGSNKISVEHKVCRDVPMDNKVIPSKEWKPKLTSSAASQATKNVAIPNDVPVAVDTIPQSSATVEKSFNGLRLSKQHVIIPDHIQVSESEKCSFIFGSINASLQQTMGSSDAECAKSSLPDYNATHELNGSDDEPQPMQRNQNSSSPVQEADSVTQPSPQIAQKMSLSFTSENDFEVKVVKDLKVKRGTATNGADSQSTQFATRASLPNDEKTPGTLVIRRSARPSIFTSKQAQVLHERFLAFLQGYQDSGCYYYREIASIMSRFGMSTMYIHYDHVGLFDQALAGTVRIFYDSVQTIMLNAVEVFLNTETGSQWTNPLVKICDLPICNSFTPLTQFWNLPGHHPSEEVVISSGDSAVTVVKATPVGRIPFLNLLLKIFETHGRGKTWGGKWDINDVMTNSNYEVEILKPYCKTFKKKYMLKDFLRCAEDVIPELQIGGQLWSGLSLSIGGQLPVFFGKLRRSLAELLISEPHITSTVWKKFFDFVTTHMSLKPSLRGSTLIDNVHEVYQTLGKEAQELFVATLNSQVLHYEWASFLNDGSQGVSSILSSVYEHNKKKVAKNDRKNNAKSLTPPSSSRTRDVGIQTDVEGNEDPVTAEGDLRKLTVEGNEVDPITAAQDEVAEEGGSTTAPQAAQVVSETRKDITPFENSMKGMVVYARHVKQHGSVGSRDVKGVQHVKRLSEVGLVTAASVENLADVLFALIYYIDKQFQFKGTNKDFNKKHYDQIHEMLCEILEEYNVPEFPIKRDLIRFEGEKVVIWASANSELEDRFRILDEYLLARSYIDGYQFSDYDMAAFNALPSAPPSKWVNLSRWYNHITALQMIRVHVFSKEDESSVILSTPEFVDWAPLFFNNVDASSEEDEECAHALIDGDSMSLDPFGDKFDKIFQEDPIEAVCQSHGTAAVHQVYGVGLINAPGDNNCFLNVIIQSLRHIRHFRDDFFQTPHKHLEDPCVVCALQDIFLSLREATMNQEGPVSPAPLRVALSRHYPNEGFFQKGVMNDASEVFEILMKCLHELDDSDTFRESQMSDCTSATCIAHNLFGIDVYERMNCDMCQLESRRFWHTSYVLNINAASLRTANMTFSDHQFDELLKVVIMGVKLACDQGDGGCGKLNHMTRTITDYPPVFTVVLAWENNNESLHDISVILDSISTEIDIGIIFSSQNQGSKRTLVALVCYSGMHWWCFAYEHGVWFLYSDETFKAIGCWDEVMTTCKECRMQPLVLFFEDEC